MSSIKKLAGQTLWYGVSSIFGRFLNYLLNPLLATLFATAEFGKISTLFAIAAFLNIFFTYGLETAYFRFATQTDEKKVYNTAVTSIIATTIFLGATLLLLSCHIANFLEIPEHPEYIQWVVGIVMIDTLCLLPFSKLRFEGRPRKFASIKILNILLNVGLVIFFLVVCKKAPQGSFLNSLYTEDIGLGYVIIANLIASGLTFLLLLKEFFKFKFSIDFSFWKELMKYSWPLIIVGFGGMINELIDRFMILKMYQGTSTEAYSESGIYAANYKLAVLIVLFIQAFRLGAEPFFFKQSTSENAQRIYARVMKFFLLACCFCFLGVVLFLDIWKYFMGSAHPEYWTGLKVVPILMLAKLFLGVYYNLSVWYKLTGKNLIGAWITLGGAAITIIINFILIPKIGYMACAIATICCYGFMMIASYKLGQKYYPIPYPWKKLTAYVIICVLLFLLHQLGCNYISTVYLRHIIGLFLFASFVVFVVKIEKKEFQKIPYLNKII